MTVPWKVDLVDKNKYSRPQLELEKVLGLVIHWTANAGATDENHADFFDGSDGGGGRKAGAHIFVDRDSATLIVPLTEGTYHANEKRCKIEKLRKTVNGYAGGANLTTIAVEMCVEKDGTIHPQTIDRTVGVMAYLCKKFHLTEKDIYRHYDITGKNCPAPFVENPSKFGDFKKAVAKLLAPVKKPVVTKPATPVKAKKYTSIVDYLKAHNMPSEFMDRVHLARKHGMHTYTGTADQNIKLLSILQTK